jgi:hypothetical protein
MVVFRRYIPCVHSGTYYLILTSTRAVKVRRRPSVPRTVPRDGVDAAQVWWTLVWIVYQSGVDADAALLPLGRGRGSRRALLLACSAQEPRYPCSAHPLARCHPACHAMPTGHTGQRHTSPSTSCTCRVGSLADSPFSFVPRRHPIPSLSKARPTGDAAWRNLSRSLVQYTYSSILDLRNECWLAGRFRGSVFAEPVLNRHANGKPTPPARLYCGQNHIRLRFTMSSRSTSRDSSRRRHVPKSIKSRTLACYYA